MGTTFEWGLTLQPLGGNIHHDPDARCQATVDDSHRPRTGGGGRRLEAIYDEDEDEIVLRRVKRKRESWLEVLKQCPVPMEDLPPRRRDYPKKLKLAKWLLDANVLSQAAETHLAMPAC